MLSRTSAVAILISVLMCSRAGASITAFWQQVTITPSAITNDPALANMQCWDLMTTTTGNWASAGVEAILPAGSFFYKHPLGGFKHPSPSAIAASPALEFSTYVNTPNDNGLNNDNTAILGGFPGPIPSLGDITANHPGTFTINWGDLFPDPPGTFNIARWTFPQGMLPNVWEASFTNQVAPSGEAQVPGIPEPITVVVLLTSLVLMRPRLSRAKRA